MVKLNKCILLIEENNLLEKYNAIWNIVSTDIIKEFDGELVYNKRFLKAKVKSYSDEVTDFHDKKIFKVHYNHTCLVVISLDSSLEKDEKYYLPAF